MLGRSSLSRWPEKLSQRIYNISGERPISYKEFVEAVKKVVPETHLSLESGRGPGHRPNGYMDITRIKEELGYQAEYDVYRGVEEYIQWLRKYPE